MTDATRPNRRSAGIDARRIFEEVPPPALWCRMAVAFVALVGFGCGRPPVPTTDVERSTVLASEPVFPSEPVLPSEPVRTDGCARSAPPFVARDVASPTSSFGATIERLCIHGASEELASELRTTSALRAGEPLTHEALRVTMTRVSEHRAVDDVQLGADAGSTPSSVVLHLVVREYPRLESVVVLPPEEHGGTLALPVGSPLTPLVARDASRALRRALLARGYGSASVTSVVEPTVAGRARLRIDVSRGPKWTVSSVVFDGAKRASATELRSALGLAAGTTWTDEIAEAATARLASHYLDRGYLDAKVDAPRVVVDDRGGVAATWTMVEGDPYRLASLTLGPVLGADREKSVRALVSSRPKDAFSSARLAADVGRIRTWLAEHGHALDVEPSVRVDADKHEVFVSLAFTKR